MSETYKTDVRVKTGKRRKITATVKNETHKNHDRFDKEAEIREKRISIIFKVIYVIAFAFAAVLTVIGESYGNGLTDTYILFACADGFLLCLLIYMLVYIFNAELKEMGRQRALVDLEATSGVVSDAGGIRTSFLTGHRQNGQNLSLFLAAELAAVVKDSEKTAHTHTS